MTVAIISAAVCVVAIGVEFLIMHWLDRRPAHFVDQGRRRLP